MVIVVANSSSYPFFFIIGTIIGPSVAVQAAEDPDTQPNNMEATTVTMASPPLIHPTRLDARLTNRWAIPPVLIISPIRIKNGTAIRE